MIYLKHKIQLIGLDMDGTLLNSRREISQANAVAIKKAQAKGITVAIVTGRAYTEALPPLQTAGLTCPILCVNGAEIRSETGRILGTFSIPIELYQETDAILKQADLYYELYTNLGIFTNDQERAISVIVDYLKLLTPDVDETILRAEAGKRFSTKAIKWVKDYYHEVLSLEDIKLYKFMVFSRDIGKLKQTRERLRQIGTLAVSSSAANNIEITMHKAQKGIALQELANKCNIPLEETMAIGDNFNDLSMLTTVGLPVAMGNAEEEIKNVCKFVTMSNDENGVAYAIERFAL